MHKYQAELEQGSMLGGHYRFTLPANLARGLSGNMLGQRPGSSLEFMDHREYLPGDDLRSIDWSAYARSDKLTIKLFREEVNPHLDIILDGSTSMALPDSNKDRATATLAALLATAAANSGYTNRTWLAGNYCRPIDNSNNPPNQWGTFAFDFQGQPQQSFLQQSSPWRPRAMRVFVSDLMWMAEPQAILSHLARDAALVIIVQLVARADMQPPQLGNMRLVDVENGQLHEVFIDEAARQRYRQRFANHQQNWHLACKQFGALLFTLIADDFIENWQLDEMVKYEILQVK